MNRCVFAGMIVAAASVASADAYHWTGAEDGFWTNANNWAEGAVPGRWYGRDVGGHIVTNGAPCDIAYFGDDLAGNAATTINFDGVHSISNLLTTGRNQTYTYGAKSDQFVPIAALGTFSAGETPDTRVAVIACRLRTGVDCFQITYDKDGKPTALYGGDKVTIRNNSSEEFVLGEWGWRTKLYEKDPETKVSIGNETGIVWDGTGDIRFTKSSGGSQPSPQTTYRLQGRLTIVKGADFKVRALTVEGDNASAVREIKIEEGGFFSHTAGYYNFLTIGSTYTLHVFGDGTFRYAAGNNDKQTVKWKCSQNTINGRLQLDCPVAMYWTTAPTDANGGTSFTPYFWQYATGTATFNAPSNTLTKSGLIWLGSAANATVEVNRLGLRGTEGAHGDADFRVANNACVRYTGAGETSDRAFIIQDGLPNNPTQPVKKTATIEQAGTGPLVLTSSIDAASGATLTFANGTAQDATFAAPITGSVSIVKSGTGVWTFGGANTYTGTTTVDGGTLAVVPAGSVAASSEVKIAEGTTLAFAAGGSYGVQKVTPTGLDARLTVGAGATLTIASLPTTAGGTLDIETADKTAVVKVTGATGAAPAWLTINGAVAEFGEDGKVQKLSVPTDVSISVYGGVIPNDATKSVGIVTVGDPSSGPITPAADATAVHTLAQKTTTAATVQLGENQTLTVGRLYVEEDKADLSVAGAGTLKAAAGGLTLWPDHEAATIAIDRLDASGATVEKVGAGTVAVADLASAASLNLAAGALVVSNATLPNVTLAGAGTFVKGGDGAWTPTQQQTGFVGEYRVTGGTVTPGASAADKVFGVTPGALVITNGATLRMFRDSAGDANLSFGEKEVRISGVGTDGLGAIDINADVGFTPFSRLTLDGDASVNVSVPSTKSVNFLNKKGTTTTPVFDMNGHALTKNGTGRLCFNSAAMTNMGPIVMSDVPVYANGDWRNFFVFNGSTRFTVPEGKTFADAPITAGNGARIVAQSLATPIPLPLTVTGTNVQFGTFSGGLAATNYDNWAGPVELRGADARLNLYAYNDPYRYIRVSGDISGEGSFGNYAISPHGRFEVLGTNNTYTGATDFTFSTGSGRHAWATFAGPHSIPDYAKTRFNQTGSANLPFGDGAWDAASVGKLLREATFTNNAHAAVSTVLSNDITIAAADLGDLSTTKGGLGAWGPGVVTLTGALDLPKGMIANYNGTLRFSGAGTTATASALRISGEGQSSTGRLEIVDGATVRVKGNNPLFGWHDQSLSFLKVDNGTLKGADGFLLKPNVANALKSRSVVEVAGADARVEMAAYFGSAAKASGAALYQSGGVVTAADKTTVGAKCSGYCELTGGEFRQESNAFVLSSATNAAGVLYIDGGRLTQSSRIDFLLGNSSGSTFAEAYVKSGVLLQENGSLCVGQWSSTQSGARGALTLAGPDAFVSTLTNVIHLAPQGEAVGVVNLNGGVCETSRIYPNYFSKETTRTFVNFDGGTLRLSKTTGADVLPNTVTRATVYAGGATFDTAGFDVTVGAALQAPSTGVVASVSWTDADAYFIGSPAVEIRGDGEGATAYAHFDSATKRVTGIEITSPGQGYTTATAYVWDGCMRESLDDDDCVPSNRVWKIACAVGAGALPSGGLTKTGEGTLTLKGANTYTGDTVVEAGTLLLGKNGALPGQSALVVRGGVVAAASGVTLPAIRFGYDVTALEEEVTYPIVDFRGSVPATLPTVLDRDGNTLVLPTGWKLGVRKGVLCAYYGKGAVVIIR